MRAERGFTLIELLIVLAIAGLMFGLLARRGEPQSARLSLEVAAEDIADAFRAARSRAILQQSPATVAFDLAQRRWKAATGEAHVLPVQLDVKLTAAAIAPAGSDETLYRFEPDGSATGGMVELTLGGRRKRVAINWLTGLVSVADAG